MKNPQRSEPIRIYLQRRRDCRRSKRRDLPDAAENIPGNGQRDAGGRGRYQGSAKDGGVEMIRTSFKECRYCNERYPGCHDECTRYKAAKAEYDRQKQIANPRRRSSGFFQGELLPEKGAVICQITDGSLFAHTTGTRKTSQSAARIHSADSGGRHRKESGLINIVMQTGKNVRTRRN